MPAPPIPATESHTNRGAIPDVLAAHFEELASLWAIRREHLHGPDWTLQDLAEWDRRLAAHIEGLVLAKHEALPLLEQHLSGDDPAGVFAAAFVLLQMQSNEAAERILAALSIAQGPQLIGLADACSAGLIESVEPQLRELAATGPPPQAVVARVALTAHGRLDPKLALREDALQCEDPHVRQLAWRCVAHAV